MKFEKEILCIGAGYVGLVQEMWTNAAFGNGFRQWRANRFTNRPKKFGGGVPNLLRGFDFHGRVHGLDFSPPITVAGLAVPHAPLSAAVG